MTLEALQYFHYLAKYKNMTQAANHFYTSQSTISRQIRAVEEEIGVRLFNRGKTIELTPAGKALELKLGTFLKHYDVLMDEVKNIGRGDSGLLRITAQGKLCDSIDTIMTRFKANFPNVQLIVEAYDFTEVSSSVLFDIYDIAFTYDFSLTDTEELNILPIASDTFSIVVPAKAYPQPTYSDIPEIVRTLPLILPPYIEPPFMKLIKYELQKEADVKRINTTYVNNTDSVILDVALGLGYSIVPTALYKSKVAPSQVSFIDLHDSSAKGKIVMISKKGHQSEIIQSYIETAKSISKNNPYN